MSDDIQEITCPSCKKINNSAWAFCGNCGCPLGSNQVNPVRPLTIPKPTSNLESTSAILRKTKIERQRPSFSLLSDLINPQSTESSNEISDSVSDFIFCPVCEQANVSGNEICISCKNPLAKTLPMVSQTTLTPKLRLMHDSGETEVYDITGSDFTIGRTQGDITFPQDNYMSNCHARIVFRDQRFILIDENSKNGIYKKIKEDLVLENGDIILIGRQVFQFEE